MLVTEFVTEVDRPNKNNRIYPSHVIAKAVAEYNSLYGQIGMSCGGKPVPEDQASHKASNFQIVDGHLQADIDTLDNPEGQLLAEGVMKGNVVFRMAGIIRKSTMQDGIEIVDDYTLVSINAVPKILAS